MARMRKSWREKLHDSRDLPRVVEINEKMSKRWGTGTCVIPAPIEVDQMMRSVPEGRLITINQIRETLARKHGATIGCPITTGIFCNIAARAAEEDAGADRKEVTPYWRTLKSKGELNEKYPGGTEAQADRLRAEGHIIEAGRGKKPPVVRGFEQALHNLAP
jgi:hypothetical protein